jgi:hypothetical protein
MVIEEQAISRFVLMIKSEATIKMSLRNDVDELERTIKLERNIM